MKNYLIILLATLFLFACSDNSNKPEAPAQSGGDPTPQEIQALCSMDPSLLTEEVLKQCEEYEKQLAFAELVKICTGDPAQIPAEFVDKCKELEEEQISKLTKEDILNKCQTDPASLPPKLQSQCDDLLKYNDISFAELVKICKGDEAAIPEILKDKCEEVNNPTLAPITFEKNGISRLSLANLEMKSSRREPNLNTELADMAKIVDQDFKDCGLSLNGSQCLDRKVEEKKELGEYLNASNELVYTVELKYLGVDIPLIMAFTQEEKTKNKYEPKKVAVFVKLYEMVEGVDLDSYLQGAAVAKLFDGSINSVSKTKRYKLQLAEFRNIRSLYHHLVGAVATTDFSGFFNNNHSILMREITKKRSVIENSDNEVYQLSTLILLKDGVKASNGFFISLCKKIDTKAKLPALKQYVSVYLGLNEPRNSKYRPYISQALEHDYAKVRLNAMRYLVRKTLSLKEQNSIIKMANDEDRAVRYEATNWARSARLNNSNLSAIKVLVESNLKEVRKFSVELLLKVGSIGSTKMLIELIDDEEDDVRSIATRFVLVRDITRSMIPLLEEPLNSKHSSARSTAIKLLLKSKDSSAINLLNDRLLIETNPVVRHEIQQAIQELRR